jgi:lincosamide nucleotidyltransferase A/C/D/E
MAPDVSGERPEMTGEDVAWLLSLTDALGVRVWIDGGWAVDACLGVQTRRHADVDIVIEQRDLLAVVSALRSHGYAAVARDDTRPWNFVLGDQQGHEVDFHVVVLDTDGAGVYGPPYNGEVFPAESLTGSGTIAGHAVACISPRWQVEFRTGYAIDATDWADVKALSERFGIRIPDDYARFRSQDGIPPTRRSSG